MKKIFLVILILFCIVPGVSAQPFGNEWIVPDQQYFKFYLEEEGLYRITAAELQAAGFPVNTVPASRLRMYRRGVEQAVRVNSSAGVITSVEFYGRGNNGADDAELYSSAGNQLHPDFSLFADKAAYFLTYSLNNTSGRRMDAYSEPNSTGLPAETSFTYTDKQFLNTRYSSGRRYSGGNIILSSYDRGEGRTGTPARTGQSIDITFTLQSAARDAAAPMVSLAIVGANNNSHTAQVLAGPDEASLRTVATTNFIGFDFRKVTEGISWDDVSTDGTLLLRVVPTATNDRVSVSTAEVTYQRQFEASGLENEVFSLPVFGGEKTFVRFTGSTSSAQLLDVTDENAPVSIGINRSGSGFTGIIRNGEGDSRNLLLSQEYKTVEEITLADLQVITPQEETFLIITGAALRAGNDPVSAYAAYRESEAGGSHRTLIAQTENLFDLFSYGDSSPLAIRRFVAFMLEKASPEFLFIIGKGLTPESDFYRSTDTELINHVPTYGAPGTDVPYTAGLTNDTYESAIPTGRINALSTEEVQAYLDKVIEMEAAPFTDLWRKRSLLLSGGQTDNEQSSFRNFIEDFEDVLEGGLLGGEASLFSKQKIEEVTFINVTDEINQGVSLITFFGHSSASTSDIEVGLVSNPELGYTNTGRYPVFLINGCNAGNFYETERLTDRRIFGDDWILTPDLGALGFLASSSFALSSNLKRFSDIFLEFGYDTEVFFGESVGRILQLTGSAYTNRFGNNPVNIAQVQQFTLNGDPAIKLFGASKPDFAIVAEEITFNGFSEDLIVTTSDSFNIAIPYVNYGKLNGDSLEVAVIRTLESGNVINYGTERYAAAETEGSVNFTIRRDPQQDESGTNSFEIFIDPLNTVEELDETNNAVTTELTILSGSTTHLFPLNYGIVPATDVEVVFQLSQQSSAEREVLAELDTAATFDSPLRQQRNFDTRLLVNWAADINFPGLQDGQVFYWRTRLATPTAGENSEWVTGSFSYKAGSPGGWRQASSVQLQNSSKNGITLTTDSRWQYDSEDTGLRVQTHGAESNGLTKDDVRVLIGGSNILIQNPTATDRFPDCAENTFNLVVFDRRSAFPYTPVFISGDESRQRLVCGRRPQLVYNLLEQDITGTDAGGAPTLTFLDSIINESAAGDIVLMFNIGDVSYSRWPEAALQELRKVGVNPEDIRNLQDGQPVVIVGKKGAAPGSALVVDSDGSTSPLQQQALELVTTITGSAGEGSVNSVRIGPAASWQQFSQEIVAENTEDSFSTEIYGIRGETRQLLVTAGNQSETDLSGEVAREYEYLELVWNSEDQAAQTPPQLKAWEILFETLPDGLIIDNNTPVVLQEGAPYQPEFGFYNYTDADFSGDLKVAFSVFNEENRSFITDTLTIPAPAAGDTTWFAPSFDTRNMLGENNISVNINVAGTPELYMVNNTISRNAVLVVKPDQVNPLLDVTFNGRYIRNGDFVPSEPEIRVTLQDENSFLLKTDTTGIRLQLKRPCENCEYEAIYFSDAAVSWLPATETEGFRVVYTPSFTEDGFYGFKVQAEDASGNTAGAEPYEINFSVISESSISNFRAYPNPFTAEEGVRFAFDLTGTAPPENLVIRIYSPAGALIRQVDTSKLGPLNIGSNFTAPLWDGTDQDGRRVKNGVYFYRITLYHQGNATEGNFIENGTGRLLLLR